MLMAKPATDFRLGMAFALTSALSFGMSGPFAKALMDAGWSPTAAVIARLAGGAVVLAVFATLVRPQWPREALQHARTVVLYGLIPIAGAQLCYYNAVAHMSVGVALLLEYTAPVMVVGWIWATTRRRPSTGTLAGVALAIAGIMLVLNIFGGETNNVDTTGVIWGLTAAVCAVFYFMMSDKVTSSAESDADGAEGGLAAITLATGGLVVGGAAVTALGVVGIMPLTFTTNDVVIAGVTAPVFVAPARARRGQHRDRLHAGHRRRGPVAAQLRVAGRPLGGAVRGAVGMAADRRGHDAAPGDRRGRRAGRIDAGTPGRPAHRGRPGRAPAARHSPLAINS